MHPSKLLIVMALRQESRGLMERAGADVLYTGVGKVNAAATLSRRLAEIRCAGAPPPLVVNLVTPFDATPPVIAFPVVLTHLPQVLCSTADSFATHRHEVAGDVVDMEAFALARVCLAENAAFACAKYVTDGADSDSATHWEAALDAASRSFITVYEFLNAK